MEDNIKENEVASLDNKGRSYATGKRKNSIARVCLKRTGAPSVLLNPSYRIHIGHGMPNCIQSVDIHS